MQRFVLLSLIVYALLLAGLATLRGGLIALSIPFMIYLLVGLTRAPDAPDLQIERVIASDRVAPGADVQISLTIRNLGKDIEELLLDDRISPQLRLRTGSTRRLIRLASGSAYTWAYTIGGARGSYAFDEVRIEATDSIGLIHRTQSLRAAGQLLVFPVVRRLKAVAIRPRRTRVYAGTIPARLGGGGTEFFGVREYQNGDSPRVVNWRLSARYPQVVYSNEFQQERVADVGIVLDARERTNVFRGGASLFEHSVQAAAALADAFLAQANRVGLLIYGSYLSWTFPSYGKIQRERVMHSLAAARVGASSVFAGLEHLSNRMFPPESQLVLVSALVMDDLNVLVQLRARGFQVMVICPDPIAFERALLAASPEVDLAARVVRMERDLLHRRLERAGVQIVEWDIARPFDQAVGPLLTRARVLARGRGS